MTFAKLAWAGDSHPVRLAAITLGVAALAFAARVTGIGFGLPHQFHPDENVLINIGTTMAAGRDWNPHFFHWGAAHFYLTAGVFRLIAATGGPPASSDQLYLAARALSAVLGAASVAATMLITHELYRSDRLTALAGTVLALMPLHVRCSHYATIDVAATFWMCLSVLCFLKAIESGLDRRWTLACGMLVGFAMGTKYTLAILLPFMAIAAAVAPKRSGSPRLAAALLLFTAAAGFVLSNPYSVLDTQAFLTGIRELSSHYDNPSLHPRNYGDHNLWFFVSTLASGESSLLAMLGGAIGLGVPARSERRPHVLILAAAPAVLFVYLGQRRANYVRNLLPLLPFLAIASAIGLLAVVAWFGRTRRRTLLAVLLLVAALGQSAQQIVRMDLVLSRPDTRDRAARWIAAQLPPASTVAIEREYWGYPTFPSSITVSPMILVDEPLSFYTRSRFDFIITTSISYEAFFNYPERMEGRSQAYRLFLASLDQHARRVATFTGPSIGVPVNDELPNPEIRIYQLARE